MATLRLDKRTGFWTVRFYWNGKQVQRTCATKRRGEANRTLAAVEDTIHLLKTGRLTIPEIVTPSRQGDWIVSGGQINTKPGRNGKPKGPRFGNVCDQYLKEQPQKHESTIYCETVHIRHLKRLLRASKLIDQIDIDSLKEYRRRRSLERHHDKLIGDATIKKELVTFRQIWGWAIQSNFVEDRCPLLDHESRWKIRF